MYAAVEVKRAIRILALFLALFGNGCIHTVGGPGRAPRPSSLPPAGSLRLIYAGAHDGDTKRFIDDLAASVSREIGRAVTIERSVKWRYPEDMGSWPAGIVEPRDGERPVVVSALHRWRCGTPAAAAMFLSAFTLGVVPYIDADQVTWVTEIYDGSGRLRHQKEFIVESGQYGWLPLVPFAPINLMWRAWRGDTNDYFVRTFPSHLVAQLASVEQPVQGARTGGTTESRVQLGDACESAWGLAPDRRPRLTPSEIKQPYLDANLSHSPPGSRLNAERGQTSAPIHNRASIQSRITAVRERQVGRCPSAPH